MQPETDPAQRLAQVEEEGVPGVVPASRDEHRASVRHGHLLVVGHRPYPQSHPRGPARRTGNVGDVAPGPGGSLDRMWPRIGGLRALALGTPGDLRSRLNSLVLGGVKTATAGLLDEYAEEDEELEHVGERLVLVDDADSLVAVVEVTSVEVTRFAEVPWDFARAEGEGDRSIEEWRAGHAAYWARVGTPVTDDSQIVCVRFRLVSAGAGGIATGDLGT